jgi:DNA-binding transcriptional LysR family regulator
MQKNMALSPLELELILVLFRKKTLTAAAECLGVEQSTLSRQLSVIEGRLGRSLFLRHRKGLTASAVVVELIPWAEKMEVILRNANQLTSGQSDTLAGEVHISCPDAMADLMLAPRIHELTKLHRKLQLKITSSEELMDLDRLDCDIAIRIGPKPVGDAAVIKLAETKIMGFGRQEYAPESGETELKHLPILHRAETKSLDSQALKKNRNDGIIFTSNRMTTSILAAKGGAGVIFLPQAFGRSMPELVEINIRDWTAPKVSIYLASPRTVRRLKHVDVVWNWIRKVFEDYA